MPASRSATLARLLPAMLAAALLTACVSHTAATTDADTRLQRLEDERAIARLLVDYGHTLDERDFAAYARLFAQDGEWRGALGTYRGPATIQAAMEKIFADAAGDIPKGSNFHVMSDFRIDVQGDRASASSRFVFYQLEKNVPVPTVSGRYDDLFVREEGRWRFLRRTAGR